MHVSLICLFTMKHNFTAKRNAILLLLLFTGLCLGQTDDAQAQYRRSSFGIGGQIGEPSGLTLKFYQNAGFAYEFLLAWDIGDDRFFLNLHGLYERPLQNTPFRFFYGPGAYIGIDGGEPENDFVLGISGSFGLSYFIDRFEVYGRLTPRLDVLPDTDGNLGGGLGLRFYP